jgi:RNA polymerase sigma factor (sigma-70 family)
VLAQLWRAAGKPDFEAGDSFWGFVETVATRRCIDWLRGKRPTSLDPEIEIRDSRAAPLESMLDDEKRELARMSVARLELPCRELIRLRATEGKSYTEIAGLLDRSEQALRAQMYRCIGKARAMMTRLAERPSLREPDEGHKP